VSKKRHDPIRVLVLIKGLGMGGAETLVADAAPVWDRDSFEYRVAFLLPWKDQLAGSIIDNGVPVTNLRWKGPGSLGAINRLRDLCADFRPNIVHSHLPAAGVIARLGIPKTRHVYTEHNIVGFYREPTRTLNRLTYGRNEAVIAVSEAVAESMSTYPGPRPTVVPNGISVAVTEQERDAVRSQLGIGPEDRLVVHVGNIRPHKGHKNLIAATAKLQDLNPAAVVISVGGEKHEGDLARLRLEADKRGLSDRIRFMGRREDARAFLSAADVVVNPSDVEGLPLVLLEAMALGRPVVATDVGGVGSIVKNGVTGLLVPPGDAGLLAQAIQHALTSPLANEWAEAASRLIGEKHSLEGMVDSYEKLYRKIIDV
jgi:glycosyltransferase involved in cell wall biosynthesis